MAIVEKYVLIGDNGIYGTFTIQELAFQLAEAHTLDVEVIKEEESIFDNILPY